MNSYKMDLRLAVEFDNGVPSLEKTQANFNEAFSHMLSLLVYSPDVIGEIVCSHFLKFPALKSAPLDSLIVTLFRAEEKSDAKRIPDVEENPDAYIRVKDHFENALRDYLKSHPDNFEMTKGARGTKSTVIVRLVPGEIKMNPDGTPKLSPSGKEMPAFRATRAEWDAILLKRKIKAMKREERIAKKHAKNGTVGASNDTDDEDFEEEEEEEETQAAAQ